MYESRADNRQATDEELIALLMAISVTSKRLARKLVRLSQTGQSKEGGIDNEQTERNGCHHQRAAGYRCFY
ncbi:MAG: hypothetical protein IKF07_06425 [Eubacterium sp.]|nr:hypothetical protein [Eubacterium sp.]